MNIKTVCLFLLMVSYSAFAEADLIYNLDLVAQGNTNPGSIQVNPSSITTVSIFLRETATSGSVLRINDVNWGVANTIFGIERTGSANNSITGSAKNNDFLGVVTNSASTATFPLTYDAIFGDPIQGEAGTLTSRLFLGSFDVTGGSVGSSSLFSVTLPTGGQNFSLGDGTPNAPVHLDAVLGTLPSLTITAVPEPTSMLLVGMIGLGGFAARRWRKRSEKSAFFCPLFRPLAKRHGGCSAPTTSSS